tara:strand:+ start:85 stop:276 length:192 start_codon:yes stop_codon:yes gene_type:complete
MAKKQTFESKLNKSGNKKNQVKLIRSQFMEEKQSIRFSEEIVVIPDGKSIDGYLNEIVKNKKK